MNQPTPQMETLLESAESGKRTSRARVGIAGTVAITLLGICDLLPWCCLCTALPAICHQLAALSALSGNQTTSNHTMANQTTGNQTNANETISAAQHFPAKLNAAFQSGILPSILVMILVLPRLSPRKLMIGLLLFTALVLGAIQAVTTWVTDAYHLEISVLCLAFVLNVCTTCFQISALTFVSATAPQYAGHYSRGVGTAGLLVASVSVVISAAGGTSEISLHLLLGLAAAVCLIAATPLMCARMVGLGQPAQEPRAQPAKRGAKVWLEELRWNRFTLLCAGLNLFVTLSLYPVVFLKVVPYTAGGLKPDTFIALFVFLGYNVVDLAGRIVGDRLRYPERPTVLYIILHLLRVLLIFAGVVVFPLTKNSSWLIAAAAIIVLTAFSQGYFATINLVHIQRFRSSPDVASLLITLTMALGVILGGYFSLPLSNLMTR